MIGSVIILVSFCSSFNLELNHLICQNQPGKEINYYFVNKLSSQVYWKLRRAKAKSTSSETNEQMEQYSTEPSRQPPRCQ